MRGRIFGLLLAILGFSQGAMAQSEESVVDIPTRPGVTQRVLLLTPAKPTAVVILLPGGHGGLQLGSDGSIRWGEGNFLVRTRQLFAAHGMLTVVVDAPSDRQSYPFLADFRQTPEHVQDLQHVMAWVRARYALPVWLVGTSRGTQSAAYVATELAGPEGPDGVVLTSSILSDRKTRPVPDMPLQNVRVPVLVVHHTQDGCALCAFALTDTLMAKLNASVQAELLPIRGGRTRGDPCEAMGYHGYNGIEAEVVQQIADWIAKARRMPWTAAPKP